MSYTGGVPLSVINETIGTLLAGSWLNSMLFMLELTQLWRYIAAFPNDRTWIRILVLFMFVVDLVATFDNFAMVYLSCITHWGDGDFLSVQNNTIPVFSISLAISVISMHAFLIYRYVMLSKNYLVAFVLVCLALTAFIGDILATWAVIRFTALADRIQLKTYATVWLTASPASDLLIALALIWELRGVKSTYKKTNSLVRRLIATAIMTGAGTATLAILDLTTYLAKPTSNLPVMFGMCIGRACTLTVLYSLNLRKANGRYSTSVGSSDPKAITNTMPLESGFQFKHGTRRADTTIDINVHKTSVVHVDGQDDRREEETTSLDRKDRDHELV